MTTDDTRPSVYPIARYDDVAAAIQFLTAAFGLTDVDVSEGPDGAIVHAELGWRNGLVMISPKGDGSSPFDLGPTNIYLAVDDPDGHHDKAVAAGAEIVMPLTDMDYGSREYAAKDPGGNVWSFGTYRPAPR
ncbi:MAG: VOC family protein [Acidimicrobiales bacterium]